jgi:hypothetical protein
MNSVAVLAFKAVYTLEAKRRENDKKIISLYVEMRDMMAVLIQYVISSHEHLVNKTMSTFRLKNVDKDHIGPDGETITGSLQELSNTTARDITACANTCDTYSKKRLFAKVMKGFVWEEKFTGFVSTFIKRRQEFMYAFNFSVPHSFQPSNSFYEQGSPSLSTLRLALTKRTSS